MRIQSIALEYHCDIAVLRRDIVHQLAVDIKFAAADVLKSCYHAERCGFTTARWSDQYDELLVLDIDVDVMDCSYLVVIYLF